MVRQRVFAFVQTSSIILCYPRLTNPATGQPRPAICLCFYRQHRTTESNEWIDSAEIWLTMTISLTCSNIFTTITDEQPKCKMKIYRKIWNIIGDIGLDSRDNRQPHTVPFHSAFNERSIITVATRFRFVKQKFIRTSNIRQFQSDQNSGGWPL